MGSQHVSLPVNVMESYGRAGLQFWTGSLSTFTLQREPTARMRQIRSYISTRRRRRPDGFIEPGPNPGIVPGPRARMFRRLDECSCVQWIPGRPRATHDFSSIPWLSGIQKAGLFFGVGSFLSGAPRRLPAGRLFAATNVSRWIPANQGNDGISIGCSTTWERACASSIPTPTSSSLSGHGPSSSG